VIVASRLLAGLGFGLAYPAINIQALSRVRDDEQGLASGLVGSSFQIGGAIVLAITTATLLAHTPAQASAAQTLHGFHTAVWVTAVTAALFVLLAFAGLLSRWRSASHDSAEIDAPQADTIETEQPLEQAA
jgi:MFS family permease